MLGEGTSLEFKEVRFRRGRVSGPTAKGLADELASFANSSGGICLLGFSDRRDVVGVPVDRIASVIGFVRHALTELIEPTLHPIIVEPLWLPDATGKKVAVVKIEVRESVFVHRSPSGYMHRVGDEKRVMPLDLLAHLFQSRAQRAIIRFDAYAVPAAGMDDLSDDLWVRFRSSRTRNDRDSMLSKLIMATKDENGALRPTVAGVLMATEDPRRWLPNAFIQAVAYRGSEIQPRGAISLYQLDAADLSGPLDAQVTQACRFVNRNMKIGAFKDLGRRDLPQFDMAAVFEALVNAVAHRDYSIHGSKIRLRLFADRLELYSPGRILGADDAESLLYTQFSRNEVVGSLLARCPVPTDVPGLVTERKTLMDKRGEGMRIIVENSLELSGRRPEFGMVGAHDFLVTIHASFGEDGALASSA